MIKSTSPALLLSTFPRFNQNEAVKSLLKRTFNNKIIEKSTDTESQHPFKGLNLDFRA